LKIKPFFHKFLKFLKFLSWVFENIGLILNFKDQGWWWWWWYCYQYYYPPLTFAKGVKIILKNLRKNWMGNRHGLWWVDYYSQTETIQIMEKTSTGIPRCMARAEVGYYQTNKPFLLMNCL